MLIGEYKHSIDAKGRIIMPAKFREDIGNVLYVTKGNDNCLRGYCEDEWRIFLDKISSLPDSNKVARAYKRTVLSSSIECEPDKQGRVLIVEKLREYAGLKKDVTVIGLSKYIEIWDSEKWEEYDSVQSENTEAVEDLSDFGL